MELPICRFVPILALTFLISPILAQITTPCSPSLLSTFTPCVNFLTNSTANGTNPTADCCNSLRNLTSNGRDCLCLVVTGSVPFQVPINRTLAISLPRACNMPGVPLQCKASIAPVPAPGPTSLGPTPSPGVSPSASPTDSVVLEPTASTLPPESSTTPVLTPPSDNGVPTSGGGIRPMLTPPSSSSASSYNISPSIMLFTVVSLLFKLH